MVLCSIHLLLQVPLHHTTILRMIFAVPCLSLHAFGLLLDWRVIKATARVLSKSVFQTASCSGNPAVQHHVMCSIASGAFYYRWPLGLTQARVLQSIGDLPQVY